VVEQKQVPGVLRIETPESLVQVDSARNAGSMERALNGALVGMIQWSTEEHGMDSKEAYLHFTVNPDVRIHTYPVCRTCFLRGGGGVPQEVLMIPTDTAGIDFLSVFYPTRRAKL
jgi:amidase